MIKNLIIATTLAAGLVNSGATPLFNDTFDSYPNGSLINNAPWVQTATTATSPIQVQDGRVLIGTTGQDVNAPFSSPYTLGPGSEFNIGVTINVSAAQTGDYFLNWSPGSTSSYFYSRLYAKSSTAGSFALGFLHNASGTTVYGNDLSLNQNHEVVINYRVFEGEKNDVASVYVDNALYIANNVWDSTNPEGSILGAINLRQGSSSSAPTLAIDNLWVEVVPEPGSAALLALGLAGTAIFRRRS